MEEVLLSNNDITLQMSHTSSRTNGIPNQTLMSIFFQKIITKVTKPVNVTIISEENNLLHMVRYEILKSESHTSESLVTFQNIQ